MPSFEPTTDIIVDDVTSALAGIADNTFDCVPTSVPYWGQRDYGFEGQIGLEDTAGAHIQKLVEVFREVRRVLKPTGVVWLNYGDNFASAINGRSAADTKLTGKDDRTHRDKPMSGVGDTGTSFGEIKEKDLIAMPWMLALSLRADGWYLRQCCIWSKPNPKPESTKDRPSTSHEYVFMLTKSPRYFFDMEAVKEPASGQRSGNKKRITPQERGSPGDKGAMATGVPWAGSPKRNLRSVWRSPEQTVAVFEEATSDDGALPSVWDINVQPFPGAHFATFPEQLVEIMLRASCSEGGCCATCGLPVRRVTEKGEPDKEWQKACGGDDNGEYSGQSTKNYAAAKAESASDLKRRILSGMVTRTTVGWKRSCECPPYANVRPLVLDPFGGAGTVGLVANKLGCDAVLIEANPEYAEIALRRINEAPLAPEALAALIRDREANQKGTPARATNQEGTLDSVENESGIESARLELRGKEAQCPSVETTSPGAPKRAASRSRSTKKGSAKKSASRPYKQPLMRPKPSSHRPAAKLAKRKKALQKKPAHGHKA